MPKEFFSLIFNNLNRICLNVSHFLSVFSDTQYILSKCNFKSFSITLRKFSVIILLLYLFCSLFWFSFWKIPYTHRLSLVCLLICHLYLNPFSSFFSFLFLDLFSFLPLFVLRHFLSFLKHSLLLCFFQFNLHV